VNYVGLIATVEGFYCKFYGNALRYHYLPIVTLQLDHQWRLGATATLCNCRDILL